MKILRNIIVFSPILLLIGCATSANYEKNLNKWVNMPADNLILKWGPPQSSFILRDGGKIIQYTRKRNVQIGGYTYQSPQRTQHTGSISSYGTAGSRYGNYSGTSTTYVTKRTPLRNLLMTCTTRFKIDKNEIITNTSWQGNDCKAYKAN